jgi:hypothetical protein
MQNVPDRGSRSAAYCWWRSPASSIEPAVTPTNAAPATGTGAFGLAMVFVLLTYGGCERGGVRFGGGSLAVPDRNREVFGSVDRVITAAYLLFVVGVLHGLGFEGLKASQAVGVDVIERAFGETGARHRYRRGDRGADIDELDDDRGRAQQLCSRA